MLPTVVFQIVFPFTSFTDWYYYLMQTASDSVCRSPLQVLALKPEYLSSFPGCISLSVIALVHVPFSDLKRL